MAEMKNLTINGTQFTLPFAPDGYGLGGLAQIINSAHNLNTLKGTGFFRWGSDMPANAPFAYSVMLQIQRGNGDIFQKVWQLGVHAGTQTSAERVVFDDVGGEWEHSNPPMYLGVEYRTTERYNGAPVYTKLIDLGSMPANGSGKWVEHGTGSQTPIRVCGRIPSYTLPLRTPSDEITISVTSDYVLVFAPASNATDWTGSTGQAQIWYTK